MIPLAFALVVAGLIGWGRAFALEMQDKVKAETGIELWRYFKNLTVLEAVEFSSSRLNSMIAMSKSVFMKRIRDLGYNRIFANTDINRKIVPNQIYDLDKTLRFKPEWEAFITEAELKPSAEFRAVSRRAEKYQTNLWFLESGELDNLIICGRATICYKIIRFVLRFRRPQLGVPDSPEAILFDRARRIWRDLNGGDNQL